MTDTERMDWLDKQHATWGGNKLLGVQVDGVLRYDIWAPTLRDAIDMAVDPCAQHPTGTVVGFREETD